MRHRRPLADHLRLWRPKRHRQGEAAIHDTRHQRGQALVIFVLATVALIGGAAIATDASWLFVSQQRMQRAADAAALAGAVYLPGHETMAISTARAEAARNGFTHGTDGIIVTPYADPGNDRRLVVDIEQPVGTYFARVFCVGEGACLETVDVEVQGRAEYVLPVPMGSPQNYYGVGHLVEAVTTTQTHSVDNENSTWRQASAFDSGGAWLNPGNAYTNNNAYSEGRNNGDRSVWRGFGLQSVIPNQAGLTIDRIDVGLNDIFLLSSSATDCRVTVETSWNGGGSWSAALRTSPLTTSSTADQVVGGAATDWGQAAGFTWNRDHFSDTAFRVRLTWNDGTASCPSTRYVRLDELTVRVRYSYQYTTTSTSFEETDVVSPDGDVLAPQNFWGALQSQGAPNIQGDAYMTYYDTRTSYANDDYQPDEYYQYAVEFPPGASAGEVWLFDPGFCHVDSDKGTGEYWQIGGANGYSTHQPVSTYYDLYDTRNTIYYTTDDTIADSAPNDAFERLSLRDPALDVSSPISAGDCSGLDWHNDWWKLADNLHGNKTYRLHVYSTDPDSHTDQRNTTALNSFAIYAKATGGTPRVYGLGAMEAYIRLPGGRASEFYLAQIDAEHAGKTMVISLWDPGDTASLSAELEILRPTTSSYQATPFSYTARRGSQAATSDCGSRSGTNVTSVVTNTGGTSLFNGCWLTIEIPLPADYTAPHPSSDTVTSEGGWWKIRYNMGSGAAYSTDLTTWEVELRGSPVHLVIP